MVNKAQSAFGSLLQDNPKGENKQESVVPMRQVEKQPSDEKDGFFYLRAVR